jgi:hypothetical protein
MRFKDLLKSEFKYLAKPLNLTSRVLLLAGVALLMASYWAPLWRIKLVAPQYAEGLTLHIHSWRIVAGNGGHDITEINNLNHYIGMKPLAEADFTRCAGCRSSSAGSSFSRCAPRSLG